MHDLPLLRDLVLIVAVAIPVVILARRFRVPAVVGFLLTGLVIGPHALGLIDETPEVRALAEVGTILLLFSVGLELSLSRILKLGREVLGGGGLQVAGTMAVVAAVAAAVGSGGAHAVFIGALVALSSTAVVLKLYTERQELDTPHGRLVVAILLFQDLCVVPLMLLLPVLAGRAEGLGGAVRDLAVSLGVVAALVAGGRLFVPWVLERVVRLRSGELFTLCIVVFGLGAAYVTSLFGLSLALGAFLAGLVISESDYGLQALSDVLPFRDAFSGIFFTSVGMLLNIGLVVQRPDHFLVLTAALIGIKAVIGVGAALVLGTPLRVAVTTGLGLAQIGEFSFVLAGAGVANGLLDAAGYQDFLGAAVLSMLATPVLIRFADPVAGAVVRWLRVREHAIATEELPAVQALRDHVIIVGYGLNGRNVARALRGSRIPYVVLEQNARVVRRARDEGEPIFFGDGTRPDVLAHVAAARARVIVFAVASPDAERRGVVTARAQNPGAHLVVRTRYVASIEELQRLGADEVVPEEFETSLEVFSRVLHVYGVPTSSIRAEVDAVRKDHYDMFRVTERPGAGHLTNLALSLGLRIGVETVEVEPGAPAEGESPMTMRLRHATGATVVAVIRGGTVIYEPEEAFRFRDLDRAVLVGTPEALAKALALFHAPEEGRTAGS